MIDLPEDEVVGRLGEFGAQCVGAVRITKKMRDRAKNTSFIILTFDRLPCPIRLVLKCKPYPVGRYVRTEHSSHSVSTYGHVDLKSRGKEVYLTPVAKTNIIVLVSVNVQISTRMGTLAFLGSVHFHYGRKKNNFVR